jgi:hypothetical protein
MRRARGFRGLQPQVGLLVGAVAMTLALVALFAFGFDDGKSGGSLGLPLGDDVSGSDGGLAAGADDGSTSSSDPGGTDGSSPSGAAGDDTPRTTGPDGAAVENPGADVVLPSEATPGEDAPDSSDPGGGHAGIGTETSLPPTSGTTEPPSTSEPASPGDPSTTAPPPPTTAPPASGPGLIGALLDLLGLGQP